MKTIVYADYGSWKMCMNTMVAQIDRMFSFIWKHKPGIYEIEQHNQMQTTPMQKVYYSTLLELGPRFLFKISLFSSILKSAQK